MVGAAAWQAALLSSTAFIAPAHAATLLPAIGCTGYVYANGSSTPVNCSTPATSGQTVYNVQLFGIVGDNATDNGPSATSGPLYALYAQIVAAGGGVMYFPCGTYQYSYMPVITKSGVSIVGENRNCATLAPKLGAGYDIHIQGGNGNDIKDIGIAPVATKTGGATIWLDNAGRNNVERVNITNPFTGVQIDNYSGGNQTANKFDSVLLTGCANTAFDLGPVSTGVVNEVFINNTTTSACANGMVLEYVNGIYVVNYSSYQGTSSVYFNARNGLNADGVFFTHLIADSTTSAGVLFGNAGGVNGGQFVNSQFDSNYKGIYVVAGSVVKSIHVSNSAFEINQYHAVDLEQIGATTNFSHFIDAVFTGNRMCFDSTSGNGNAPELYTNNIGLIFEDNTMGACGPQSTTHASTFATVGVSLGAASNNSIVMNNRGQGLATAVSDAGGTNVVKTNNELW